MSPDTLITSSSVDTVIVIWPSLPEALLPQNLYSLSALWVPSAPHSAGASGLSSEIFFVSLVLASLRVSPGATVFLTLWNDILILYTYDNSRIWTSIPELLPHVLGD